MGHNPEEKLSHWRVVSIRYFIRPFARIHLLMCGVTWVRYNYKQNKDYRKWLGPDWKPTFDGAGIMVCNHQTWLDIMLFIYSDFPAFISDSKVRNIIGVGKIAVGAQTVFTVRGGTKEARLETLKIIEERQI